MNVGGLRLAVFALYRTYRHHVHSLPPVQRHTQTKPCWDYALETPGYFLGLPTGQTAGVGQFAKRLDMHEDMHNFGASRARYGHSAWTGAWPRAGQTPGFRP